MAKSEKNSNDIYCKPYVILWRESNKYKQQLESRKHYSLEEAEKIVKINTELGNGLHKIMKLIDI